MPTVTTSIVGLTVVLLQSCLWRVGLSQQSDTIIGIDLGTTYSCVAVFKFGRVDVLANSMGNRVTPSYVAFTAGAERLVGEAAQNQVSSNPENTVFNVKRLIGRRFSDDSVQQDIKNYPFKVTSSNNKPLIEVRVGSEMKRFAPEEISAMVLSRLKETAEDYLGSKVIRAVVTVPAYFNDAQRQATKDAGRIAGLNVIRIINEPTAAAIAYGMDRKENDMKIVVFDLGGGTFDVTALKITSNGEMRVVATGGDTHLGGEDFDVRVIDHFIQLYEAKKRKDIRSNNRAYQRLRREVEKGKRILATQLETRIDIESFIDGQDFSEVLTRAKFDELNKDLFSSTIAPLQKVLEDANWERSDVDDVVLVGGSTRIVKVQQLVKEFFNGKGFTRGINPDEAVAYGAAIQAGVLGGEQKDLSIIDVIPLTLGIEVRGQLMSEIIKRNTPLPVKASGFYTTVHDYQTGIGIYVYEGERPLTTDNHLLGQFLLEGIPPAPRGVPSVEVTFEVSVEGILTVTAEIRETGKKEGIVIESDRGLSSAEIDRMTEDAEVFAQKDRESKRRVHALNQLEDYIYSVKNHELFSEKGYIYHKVLEVEKWHSANRQTASADDIIQQQRDLEDVMDIIRNIRRIRLEL